MLNSLFGNSTLPVLEEATWFTQARHGVLASNIANIDTPGYQVRDLSPQEFEKRLREALEVRDRPQVSLGTGELTQGGDGAIRKVRESLRTVMHHDGTDVGIEQQVTELNKNQFLHSLAISLMASQFRLLQTAVSERV